jgi:hypothetical protein
MLDAAKTANGWENSLGIDSGKASRRDRSKDVFEIVCAGKGDVLHAKQNFLTTRARRPKDNLLTAQEGSGFHRFPPAEPEQPRP